MNDKYEPAPVNLDELKHRCMKDPAFKVAYDALDDKFAVIGELIGARTRAGLTQDELAERMGTTKSAAARIEGDGEYTSLATLRRYADAVGCELRITLTPLPAVNVKSAGLHEPQALQEKPAPLRAGA